jgi:hypothetical protein
VRLHTTLAVLVLVTSCGRGDSSDQRVRAVIAEAEAAAEARDVGAAMALVAEDYRDAREFDRRELRQFVHGWFVLNQSIRLIVRVDELVFPADELAQARVTVGMLGTRDDGSESFDFAVDVYEFDVELVNVDGEWRLRRADLVRRL